MLKNLLSDQIGLHATDHIFLTLYLLNIYLLEWFVKLRDASSSPL